MSFGEDLSDGVYHALREEERREEEAEEERQKFDAAGHFMKVRGGADYLEVKWRIVWFRQEYPHGTIVTEMIKLAGEEAIFKATVTDGEGGVATGHGSETASDFGDFLEKSETKAIGRALASMGFGTTAADHEMGNNRRGEFTVVDAGVQRQPQRNGSGPSRSQPAPLPQPGRYDRPASDPSVPASEKQVKFLAALRSQTGLGDDVAFSLWLDQHALEVVEGEAYTKAQAGQIINALNDYKSKTR